MRIIITNSDIPSSFIGGITRVCVTLARQWMKQGHDVLFVCTNSKNCPNPHLSDFCQVVLPDGTNLQSAVNHDAFERSLQEFNADVILHPFMHDSAFTQLCFYIRKDADIPLALAWHFAPTHSWDIMDRSFFIPMKVKSSLLRNGYDTLLWLRWNSYRRRQIIKIRKLFFQECIAKSDSIILLSSRYLQDWENIVGYHSDKVHSINNPVIFGNVSPIDYSKKEKIVLWVGRIGYDMKRTDKMLSIWSHIYQNHPDWRLVVCGPGDAQEFAEWSKKKGMTNVEFSGIVKVEEYYQRASILCNTSVTEGMPLVIMESMEYGCVPMAFDSFKSVSDLIQDGENGYIIPAFNVDVFVNKLENLIGDTQLRQQMAEAGRVSLTRFDKSMIAEQWIRLFNPLR